MTQINVYIIKPIVRSWVPNINFWYTVVFIYQQAQAKLKYRKILKISPRTYIFQRPFLRGLFWRGLYSERLIFRGKFAFKIDWATLIVKTKFAVFALFYFVFEGNFPRTGQGGGEGGLYLEGRVNVGFFALPVWGAYTGFELGFDHWGTICPLG